jgi:hypothetical protein
VRARHGVLRRTDKSNLEEQRDSSESDMSRAAH